MIRQRLLGIGFPDGYSELKLLSLLRIRGLQPHCVGPEIELLQRQPQTRLLLPQPLLLPRQR